MSFSISRSSRLSIFVLALAYTGLTFGTLTAPTPVQTQPTDNLVETFA